MTAPAERMKTMRERRRASGVREVRLLAPDARLASVQQRVADQVARLPQKSELAALGWIEAVSELDEPDGPRNAAG